MQDNRKDYMYLRLSKEDGDVEEGNAEVSNSIISQRVCIQQYLKGMPEFHAAFEEIIDDGYSGTNMNRPGMQQLLQLMRNGQVRTIVVRDLSRFARNYLEAGHYLEFIFPAYDVRFISINDQYDSKEYGESTGGLELAIRNLINQMYSRDISRKIKSAVDLKKRAGEYVYGTAPYGYKKGEKKNTIVIDPVVAPVVKNIFQWAAEGLTVSKIAYKLNENKVTTPSVYLAPIRGKYKTRPFWSYESVRNIIRNRIYTGDTVPFKSHVVRVGSDNVKQIPEAMQEVIPCTHEPIISRELYYQAAKVIKSNVKSAKKEERYLFTSYLFCSCCGNRLVKGKATNKNWLCTSARYNSELECGQVRIREEELKKVVLHAIQNLCKLLDAKVEHANARRGSAKPKRDLLSDEIRYLKKQIARHRAVKMEYYEKYVSSQITKEEFLQKKADLFEQTEVFEQNLRDKEAEWNTLGEDGTMQEMAMLRARKITQYQNVEELSPELMRELVRKIVVMPGNRIEIVWNFEDEISKIVSLFDSTCV